MERYEPSVFISYAWGGEREEIVNKIDQSLQQRGLKIIRDKRDLGYKGSITEFMERIGQGNCVIVVVSDKYLKSSNCMFELVEVAGNKQLRDRIFPIVLPDANIYDPVKRLEYVRYWEAKRAELADAMRTVDPANLKGIREEIDNYDRFRDEISELASTLKDMNTLTPEMHEQSDFEALYAAIQKQMQDTQPRQSDSPQPGGGGHEPSSRGSTAFDQRGQKVKNQTNINGDVNGPIFSGNFQGPVQADNITVGDITGSTGVAIGSGARADVRMNTKIDVITEAFRPIRDQINAMKPGPDKMDAEQAVQILEQEARKGDAANAGRVQKWLNFLAQTAGDAWEVAVTTFANPAAGVGKVLQLIAARAKEEGGKRS